MSKNIVMSPGIPEFDTPEFATWLREWYASHPPARSVLETRLRETLKPLDVPEGLRDFQAVIDKRINEVFGA